MADSDIPVVVIVVDDARFARQEFVRQQQELNRLPEWVIADELRMDETGMRTQCVKGHLFVNALSKFCHQCGEPR